METDASARTPAREILSARRGRSVSADEVREATESLLAFFRLLREWNEKARATSPEFETGKVRGVAPVPCPAYPSAASGPRRAAR